MILLIDNYDSFTYNLAQYIGNFAEVQVLRNDDPKLLSLIHISEPTRPAA